MSLFGAATSGVDPQTGSYLNKEQRIALFRASQGRGGSRRRRDDGGGAIVVAKQMTSVVRELRDNYQKTTSSVSEQVKQNTERINNLYRIISADKEAEAKREALETQDARLLRENKLRTARENLIEGLSKGVAGLFAAGQKAANAVMKPISSLWDKLKKALLTLLGLWALDNLPFFLEQIGSFTTKMSELGKLFSENILGIRGVWAGIKALLKGIFSPIRKIIGVVADIAVWIGKKALSIGGKVFGAIGKFLKSVIIKALDALGDAFSAAKRALTGGGAAVADGAKAAASASSTSSASSTAAADSAPAATKAAEAASGATAASRAASDGATAVKQLPGTEPTTAPKPKKNFIQNQLSGLGDKIKAAFSGQNITSKETAEKLGDTKTSPGSATTKIFNKMTKYLEPVLKNLPKGTLGAVKGVIKMSSRALGSIPVIGTGIDFILNSLDGVPLTENLIRSVSSGLGGEVGAAAGGYLGFLAGLPFGGVGSIPGAIIGAILGGIGGGMLGDRGGKLAMEAFGLETTETSTDRLIDGTVNIFTGDKVSPNKPGETDKPTEESEYIDNIFGDFNINNLKESVNKSFNINITNTNAIENNSTNTNTNAIENNSANTNTDTIQNNITSTSVIENNIRPTTNITQTNTTESQLISPVTTEQPTISPSTPNIPNSTPEGMGMERIDSSSEFNVIDLPPTFTNMFDNMQKNNQTQPNSKEEVDDIPEISSYNPETSYYSELASQMFGLAI